MSFHVILSANAYSKNLVYLQNETKVTLLTTSMCQTLALRKYHQFSLVACYHVYLICLA